MINLYVELIALMSNCLVDRPCSRRIQEIRLLLERVQEDGELPPVLQDMLEKIGRDWQTWSVLQRV
jgi:hypothetical protein